MRLSRMAAAIMIFLVLIALAATLPGLALGSDAARRAVVARLEHMTGEPVTIEGDIAFSLLPRTRIIVDRVRIGATGSLTIGQIVADLDAMTALTGSANISRMVLIRPDIKSSADRPKANAAPSRSDAKPRQLARMLLGRIEGLRRIEIRDGAIHPYPKVAGGGISDINLIVARASSGAALRLSGSFLWNGQPADVDIDIGAPDALVAGGSSGVDINLSSAPLTANFDGTASLDNNATINGRIELTGASLRNGIGWFADPDLRIPDVGPFSLKGDLLLAGLHANLQQADISIAGSRGHGALEASFAPAAPVIGGTLAFASLDFSPFARAVLPLPVDPFDLKRPIDIDFAKAVKLDIRLSAAQANLGPLPLRDVAAVVRLGDGRAELDIGDAAVFGGRSQAKLVFDANAATLSATGHLSATGIDTASLLKALKIEAVTMTGRSSLSADVTAPFRDWASILGRARVEAEFVSRDGTIRGFSPKVFALSGTRPLADGLAGTTVSYTGLEATIATDGAGVRLKGMTIENGTGVLAASGDLSLIAGDVTIRGRYDPRAPKTASSQAAFTTSKPIAFTIGGKWPNPDVTTQ
ncbi:AsmA family protein [Aurantimonas marina]|uniref:AsmA family protein n=1 Tax=Aurantimonas marina TaxID=2780508 RepID=UPI0019D271A1|nr:AsmA-like C-terminal region-containing protein [Aurantimonas marina]